MQGEVGAEENGGGGLSGGAPVSAQMPDGLFALCQLQLMFFSTLYDPVPSS